MRRTISIGLLILLAASVGGAALESLTVFSFDINQLGYYAEKDGRALAHVLANYDIVLVQGIVALGDSSNNRWLFGFGPGRRAFYRAIPTDTAYQRRLSDPEQRLEVFGTDIQVFPWDAEAGAWTFYTDLLIGRTREATTFRADPRYLFVEQATFTAPWGLTLRGAKIARLAQLLSRKGLGGSSA